MGYIVLPLTHNTSLSGLQEQRLTSWIHCISSEGLLCLCSKSLFLRNPAWNIASLWDRGKREEKKTNVVVKKHTHSIKFTIFIKCFSVVLSMFTLWCNKSRDLLHLAKLKLCTCAHALSRVWLFVTSWAWLLCPWDSPGKNTGVG